MYRLIIEKSVIMKLLKKGANYVRGIDSEEEGEYERLKDLKDKVKALKRMNVRRRLYTGTVGYVKNLSDNLKAAADVVKDVNIKDPLSVASGAIRGIDKLVDAVFKK